MREMSEFVIRCKQKGQIVQIQEMFKLFLRCITAKILTEIERDAMFVDRRGFKPSTPWLLLLSFY